MASVWTVALQVGSVAPHRKPVWALYCAPETERDRIVAPENISTTSCILGKSLSLKICKHERTVRWRRVLNKGTLFNHKSALMGGGRVSRFSRCRKDSGEILDRDSWVEVI